MDKATVLGDSRRRFDYDRRLLPNARIAALEPDEVTDEHSIGTTDWSIGYPGWNLLYYSLYCSILHADLIAAARENVESAGLTDHVRFHEGDAIEFLADAAARLDRFDFVLIDDNHTTEHVLAEIDIVCPKVAAGGGKVYFDNTAWGPVALALQDLPGLHGGNLIQFDNCSWRTPGNAIWQPH
jgi:hypothetical protein